MKIPHCYEDTTAVEPFFQKAKECLPFLAYEPIQRAYSEQDKMFKCVAITHLINYFKKAAIAEEDFKELISLLDTFRDPYQDFIEEKAKRSWAETKTNLLGGVLNESCWQ
ncbi:hypothetical protein C0966_17010 (plasmid) [Bacillus methanolicus]|uniref:hypothetical protein n=1 Tax=Bacillus methanolicus TaxID=1471 RepID=UPI00237FF3BA|nr:hypothetical protein [Bacillus methanolicus]MDE3840967.1 hypothetical protein [Bacillus methanolicus]